MVSVIPGELKEKADGNIPRCGLSGGDTAI